MTQFSHTNNGLGQPLNPDEEPTESDEPPARGSNDSFTGLPQPKKPSVAKMSATSVWNSEITGSGPRPSRAFKVPPNPSSARLSLPSTDAYLGSIIDDRYTVEAVLGTGGMGVVYAGRHRVINKRIAIKVLRSEMSQDREMTERFLQEAQAASSIGHPHIVDISDYGNLPDGAAYFIMEFLEGHSLSKYLKTVQPVPFSQLIHIARQVTDALAAAHRQHIIHRDLKPDNIFLVQRGSEKDFVKILDFGIAKVANSTATKLTRAGTVFGTPHYMSPEQAAGLATDHRTDIYSLGIILYEMIAGQVPFHAENYMGILTQHMYKSPTPLQVIAPQAEVHPGLEAIIFKCLSKKPEDRYPSMEAVLSELDRLRQGSAPMAIGEMISRSDSVHTPLDYFHTQGSPHTPVASLTSAPPAFRRRNGWAFYGGIAGVAIAIGGTAAFLSRDSTTVKTPALSASSGAISPTQLPVSATDTAASGTAPVVKGKSVMLIADPIDTEVFQNNQSLGPAPVSLLVPDGASISLELRREGYKPKLVILDGKLTRHEVKMSKNPAPRPAAAPGRSRGAKTSDEIVDPWK